MAPTSLTVDRVQPGDEGVLPDGYPDGVFSATIHGPVRSLFLNSTDAMGACLAGQQYDTVVGVEPIDPGLGCGFTMGGQTWVLGVAHHGDSVLLNQGTGALPQQPDGTATFDLYAANNGFFGVGTYWLLTVEFADATSLKSAPLFY